MFIDKSTGTIRLPNGFIITTELDRTGFANSVYFSQATPYDYGTLPFQWYRLQGGQLDGHVLHVNLCFYEDVLVDYRVKADFYQPKSTTWENFSFDIESQAKAFHDQLLQDDLGEPHKRVLVPVGQNQPVLDYRIEYSYKWGSVWSAFDGRSGSSSVRMGYGSRLRDAQDNYREKKV